MFSLYLHIPDLDVLLRLYDDWQFHKGDLIFITITLGEVILLLYLNTYNKLLCLRTYIIFVIINIYPLDKTSALDQPCYQWCKLLPTVRLSLITKTHTPSTEPPRFNNINSICPDNSNTLVNTYSWWVSGSYWTLSQQFFIYSMAKTFWWNDDDVCFELDQHTYCRIFTVLAMHLCTQCLSQLKLEVGYTT